MPNYSLVVNSTFQPFTYQELMAPVQRLSDVHDLIAAQYDELSTKADVLEALGEKDRDSDSYSRYKAYSDQLRQEAEELMRGPLKASSKARLMSMRRDYNKIIVPIQNAWNKREEEAKEQRTLAISNPSIMFTRTAANTSIDHYVNNPTGGYGVINGNLIRTQMSDMVKNLAKQYEEGRISVNDIDPYTRQIIERKGMTPDEINHWLRDPDAFPTLTRMRDQVLEFNGVTPEIINSSENGREIWNKSVAGAQMGAWDAVGETSVKIGDNFINQLRAKEASEIRIAQKKYEIEHPATETSDYLPYSSGSQFNLPMATADYSPAKDQENALTVLGYNKQKDGKLLFTNGEVTIPYVSQSEQGIAASREYNSLWLKVHNNTATEEEKEKWKKLATSGRYTDYGDLKNPVTSTAAKASLYDKDGKLLSREEFVKQANGSKEKEKAFHKYYNKIEEAYETLGLSLERDNKRITHQDITRHYNRLRENNAAQFATVRALNYEADDWNPTMRALPIREIKSYRRGKPVYDTKFTTLSELLNRKVDNQKVDVTPFWNEDGEEEGIIFAVTEPGGKQRRYFMSADNISESNVQEARTAFANAKKYDAAGRTAEAGSLREYAMGRLHTGMTMHNKSYEQSIVGQRTLKQSGLTE